MHHFLKKKKKLNQDHNKPSLLNICKSRNKWKTEKNVYIQNGNLNKALLVKQSPTILK